MSEEPRAESKERRVKMKTAEPQERLKMAAAILDLIEKRKYVTFCELEQEIEGFRGDYYIYLDIYKNLIFWHRCSEAAIAAVGLLLESRKAFLRTTSLLNYAIESGGVGLPRLPLAKSIRAYAKARWMPVTLTNKNQ